MYHCMNCTDLQQEVKELTQENQKLRDILAITAKLNALPTDDIRTQNFLDELTDRLEDTE